jgi:hypothetical protein
MDTLKPYVRKQGWVDGYSLMLVHDDGHHFAYAKPLQFIQIDKGESVPEDSFPTCVLNKTSAQMLMDELWDCGIRPSEGSGSAGALLATQNHLKDMKSIAFHVLKIK